MTESFKVVKYSKEIEVGLVILEYLREQGHSIAEAEIYAALGIDYKIYMKEVDKMVARKESYRF